MAAYIIAEAGVNHNGSMDRARELIDAAAGAGANAVKFQLFRPASLVSEKQELADYQKKNAGGDSQLAMLEELALVTEQQQELKSYTETKGIDFLTSPFDMESLADCYAMGLHTIKVPSGELLNIPMLREISRHATPVILSTGMAGMDEISIALDTLLDGGVLKKESITVLHCNTEYPTPMEDVNLTAMQTIGEEFSVAVGYSDHTLGIEIPVAAVALGAKVIEKHFTLDKNLPGPDHKASLSVEELTAMVAAIRNIEKALGDGVKAPSASEQKNLAIVRKRIVAARPIEKGVVITEEDLALKRAPSGMYSEHWDKVVGATAPQTFEKDEGVTL